MTIGYAIATRNDRMDQVTAAVDAGTAGKLKIYNGTRPSTGGSATTLLASLDMSTPSFGPAAGGKITANNITSDASANATGTATWFRVEDSTGAAVFDGSVGTTGSGADLELSSVSIGIGNIVAVTSLTLTEGNP